MQLERRWPAKRRDTTILTYLLGLTALLLYIGRRESKS